MCQGHSVGSGVLPDCLPVEEDAQYLSHGTSLEAARLIIQQGLSRRNRLRIHFYECDRNDQILGGETARAGSEATIAVAAHQCVEGGIFLYRSDNNVILSEGFRAVIGPRYYRFAMRLNLDSRRSRSVVWEPPNHSRNATDTGQNDNPPTVFTQTFPANVSPEQIEWRDNTNQP